MTEAGSIVIDRNGYLGVLSRSAATFDLDARLPDQVFREGVGDSLLNLIG